ncbi:16S rRNA (cytidine(1402)-2'-O)-methyltransferase [Candidatus Methylospira mobilis]|uniref:Ribosomal RNA small subunit methyltransferase I n=1 Tax=Candidatus Methylospira mobilis TaxID=1808979 RepID=A0A5Q0BGU1_9GAMM|nr:16S rRNA (cytidine(1402)-2'-O)-methyltransferase [Candidatus Methylospira mobilis]QFY41431.1 16S rRNA (cytidine(1402)-2'-O)-methyltransferase [Candidatus Methylospira mobilis]
MDSNNTSTPKGILYIVATPIGNLRDLSLRAIEVLRTVDFIAAEDTRHSRPLLDYHNIDKPLLALHEHNEKQTAQRVVERLLQAQSAALISDAGTPLINDPGFPLVRLARTHGIRVSPIPGPCALIATLSASGLPVDRFSFEGFPPRNSQARLSMLKSLTGEQRTLGFYESSHRILEFIEDIGRIFPPERPLVIARELTKMHETIVNTSVAHAAAVIAADPYMQRGEFVVLIQGAEEIRATETLSDEQMNTLELLLEECSLKSAVALCCKITGARKEIAYKTALSLQEKR